MSLLGTVARRAARAATLLFVRSASVFLLSRAMPGDAWTDLQADPSVSAQTLRELRAEYGLDRPPLEQYVRWLWQALHGRFGYSPVERLPVSALLWQRLVRTLALASETLVLILTAAIAASSPIVFGVPKPLAGLCGDSDPARRSCGPECSRGELAADPVVSSKLWILPGCLRFYPV